MDSKSGSDEAGKSRHVEQIFLEFCSTGVECVCRMCDTCAVCEDHRWVIDPLFWIECKFPLREEQRYLRSQNLF